MKTGTTTFNEIDTYANIILKKQLQKTGVSNAGLYVIINDVKTQLYSIIKNWNDTNFRNTILLIGSEEGIFYEPQASNDVRNMVVVAIRNSKIETINSDNCAKLGLKKSISSSQVKSITSAAIEYFKNINLSKLAPKISTSNNFYYDIAEIYPIAWKALTELSKCTKENLEHDYQKIKIREPLVIDELINGEIDTKRLQEGVIEDGITPTLGKDLLLVLNSIQNGKTKIFYADSFKWLTRNFEKLLRVLEFILTHNAWFVTNNYFISDNYVSRRKALVKSAHSVAEFHEKYPSAIEVSKKHRQSLTKFLELS